MDDIQKFAITIRSQVVLSILNKYGEYFDTSEVISRAEAISNFILNGEKPVEKISLSPPVNTTDPAFTNVAAPIPYKCVFDISGHVNVPIQRTIYADALIPAVEHFRALHPLSTIEYIDDREVIGLDEETLHPIFEGDEYTIDPEAGSYTLVKSAPWPAGEKD